MEHELAFRAMPGNGAMVVKSICSKSGTFSVPCEIKRTMQSWLELGISHGGIFISHEALNLVDWSLPSLQANRWVLFIDESPCPWSYYNRRHPITNTHVQEMLAWSELPISGDKEEDESLKKYVQVSLSAKGEALATSGIDDLAPAYASLLNTIRHGKTAVGNRSFFEPTGKKNSSTLSVFSVTDPHRFAVFSSVTILSANFRHTFAYLLWNSDAVTFSPHPVLQANRRRAVPLSARTRIFSFGPKDASINWFKEQCQPLKAAGEWLATHINRPAYYTLNGHKEIVDPIRSRHWEKVAPIAIGSNRLTDITAAAWLVSLKAKPLEYATIRSVFGITRDQFDRAREHEALYQFALRSNLRDFNSATPVDLYVVSDRQAKYLCDVLGVAGFEQVGVNLPQSEKPATDAAPIGRPPKHQTAEERLEAQRKSKRESAQRTRAQQRINQQQQKAA